MAIDIFENYRIDQELEQATQVPQFKWSQANRGAYRAAKDQFYKDFDQMGNKIAFILKDAPLNKDNTRYIKGSDQLEIAKKYIRDFNQAFYSINDEFTKHIDKDTGFKLKQANMHDLFSTTMVDIVDHGGYDPRELEAAMTGNAKVSEAINNQTKSQITIYKDQLKSYQDSMTIYATDTSYGKESTEYKAFNKNYMNTLTKLEEISGLEYGISDKDFENYNKSKSDIKDVKGAFDLADYEPEYIDFEPSIFTNYSRDIPLRDQIKAGSLGEGVKVKSIQTGINTYIDKVSINVGGLKAQFENNYFNNPQFQRLTPLTKDSSPVITLADRYGLKRSAILPILEKQRQKLNKESIEKSAPSFDKLAKKQTQRRIVAKRNEEKLCRFYLAFKRIK